MPALGLEIRQNREHSSIYTPVRPAAGGPIRLLALRKAAGPEGSKLDGGRTSNVSLAVDEQGNLFVSKSRKADVEEINQRRELEFSQTGFSHTEGNTAHLRSLHEQAVFAIEAARLGLSVVVPEYEHVDGTVLYVPYFPGKSLQRYLEEGQISALGLALDDVFKAHHGEHRNYPLGVLYGERWPSNILVNTPGTEIKHIDFDLQVQGPYAREFELAQLLYGTLIDASRKNDTLAFLRRYLKTKQQDVRKYDVNFVIQYMNGYLNRDKTGNEGKPNISHEVEELSQMLLETVRQ